jgi:hypothetical protein
MKNEKTNLLLSSTLTNEKKLIGKKNALSLRPMRSMVRLKSLKPKSVTIVSELKLPSKEL